MFKFLAPTLLAIGLSGTAVALDVPTGKPMLVISGNVAETNSEAGASFDIAMLEALPQQTLVTSTPWYPEVRTFRGPLLRDLLTLARARGTKLQVTALNDYQAALPIQDIEDYGVILALTMNGKPLTVRDKGPSFILYPFDERPELKTDTYYNRCVWQIKSIRIE